MAIGSAPEIGTKFGQGKESFERWMNGGMNEWRKQVGDDLLGGYAKLLYDPQMMADIPEDADVHQHS